MGIMGMGWGWGWRWGWRCLLTQESDTHNGGTDSECVANNLNPSAQKLGDEGNPTDGDDEGDAPVFGIEFVADIRNGDGQQNIDWHGKDPPDLACECRWHCQTVHIYFFFSFFL